MEESIIIPNYHVSFLGWGQQDVLRLEDPVLDAQNKLANLCHILNNTSLLLLGATQIKLSGTDSVNLKGFFARKGVHPDQWILFLELANRS
jgi:hypothetical protein